MLLNKGSLRVHFCHDFSLFLLTYVKSRANQRRIGTRSPRTALFFPSIPFYMTDQGNKNEIEPGLTFKPAAH